MEKQGGSKRKKKGNLIKIGRVCGNSQGENSW